MQFGWGRAKPSLCGTGCGAAAGRSRQLGYAVWGSSQAEPVLNWLRCGGEGRRRRVGCGAAAKVCAAAAAAAKLERG